MLQKILLSLLLQGGGEEGEARRGRGYKERI
jgi:hypothetical protein